MSIDHNESVILGSWILVNGQIAEDDTCRRIHSLIKDDLQQIATANDGWETLYEDHTDGRYWERFYPRSEMQGGGPPALRAIGAEEAKQKYRFED